MNAPPEPISIPAIDLRAQYATIRDEIVLAVMGVIESQYFILGPEVAAVESEVANYCGAKFAVGCASGSDALLLPLMAWDIGPGDEVITSPYTFFATGGAIWRTGAKIVFVDIDPTTYNLDPAKLADAISPRSSAIIPVHLYGQTAEMDPINEIAKRHNVRVLEDAAQAIGSAYLGRHAGCLGDAAAFSFYPSKNLGAFGDAGMVVTNDEDLAKRMARLRVHGMEPKYYHHEVGFNARLDALQAAVLRVKLRHLDAWTQARRDVAARYRVLFEEAALSDEVTIPSEQPNCFHVYNQFVIRVPAHLRDRLRKDLADKRIGTEVYYPIPLHLQECFTSLGYRAGDFPESEAAARETIALPIFPELTEESQAYVVDAVARSLHESSHTPRTGERAA